MAFISSDSASMTAFEKRSNSLVGKVPHFLQQGRVAAELGFLLLAVGEVLDR